MKMNHWHRCLAAMAAGFLLSAVSAAQRTQTDHAITKGFKGEFYLAQDTPSGWGLGTFAVYTKIDKVGPPVPSEVLQIDSIGRYGSSSGIYLYNFGTPQMTLVPSGTRLVDPARIDATVPATMFFYEFDTGNYGEVQVDLHLKAEIKANDSPLLYRSRQTSLIVDPLLGATRTIHRFSGWTTWDTTWMVDAWVTRPDDPAWRVEILTSEFPFTSGSYAVMSYVPGEGTLEVTKIAK